MSQAQQHSSGTEAIEQNRRDSLSDLLAFPREQRDILGGLAEDVRLVERRLRVNLISPNTKGVAQEMNTPAIDPYQEQVKTHSVKDLDNFEEAEARGPGPGMPFGINQERDPIYEYDLYLISNARFGRITLKRISIRFLLKACSPWIVTAEQLDRSTGGPCSALVGVVLGGWFASPLKSGSVRLA